MAQAGELPGVQGPVRRRHTPDLRVLRQLLGWRVVEVASGQDIGRVEEILLVAAGQVVQAVGGSAQPVVGERSRVALSRHQSGTVRSLLLRVSRPVELAAFNFSGVEQHLVPLVPRLLPWAQPASRCLGADLPKGLLDLGRQQLHLNCLRPLLKPYLQDGPFGKKVLEGAGRQDLVQLVQRAGGTTQVAAALGLHSARRPAGSAAGRLAGSDKLVKTGLGSTQMVAARSGYWCDPLTLEVALACFVARQWVQLPGSGSRSTYFYNPVSRRISAELPRLPQHLAREAHPLQTAADPPALDNSGRARARWPLEQHPNSWEVGEGQEELLALDHPDDRVMPTALQLKAAKRWDLYHALIAAGGHREVAQLLGRCLASHRGVLATGTALAPAAAEPCPSPSTAQQATLQQQQQQQAADLLGPPQPTQAGQAGLPAPSPQLLSDLEEELGALVAELELAPGSMPTEQQLLECGRADLVGAVRKLGGFAAAASALGRRSRRCPRGAAADQDRAAHCLLLLLLQHHLESGQAAAGSSSRFTSSGRGSSGGGSGRHCKEEVLEVLQRLGFDELKAVAEHVQQGQCLRQLLQHAARGRVGGAAAARGGSAADVMATAGGAGVPSGPGAADAGGVVGERSAAAGASCGSSSPPCQGSGGLRGAQGRQGAARGSGGSGFRLPTRAQLVAAGRMDILYALQLHGSEALLERCGLAELRLHRGGRKRLKEPTAAAAAAAAVVPLA
ncbi:hypothetical protein V8C86DRAFT_3197862 [Haematococcus lacustris]